MTAKQSNVSALGTDYRVRDLYDALVDALEEKHEGLSYAAIIGVLELLKANTIKELTYDDDYRD